MENIDCVMVQGQLADYAGNLLMVHERLRVATHLTNCPACQEALRKIKEDVEKQPEVS